MNVVKMQEDAYANGAEVPSGLTALQETVSSLGDFEDVVGFLQRLLQIDASCRPTARQALAHPFFDSLNGVVQHRGEPTVSYSCIFNLNDC